MLVWRVGPAYSFVIAFLVRVTFTAVSLSGFSTRAMALYNFCLN